MTTTARILIAASVLICAALPSAAMAAPAAEHLTYGPAGGNAAAHVTQGFVSADGDCVVFETTEKLVAEDPNARNDIYERCGSTVTLVSTGPAQNADTAANPFISYRDVAANGCVLFYSNEQLTGDDGDSRIDLYKRCGATVDRVSQGPTGGNAAEDVVQGTLSRDGVCAVFSAHEALTADDGDSIPDLYERCGTTTRRITQGPAGGDSPSGYANLDGMTPDGSCVLFTTSEPLTADDTDSEIDAYTRCGTTTTHVSPGNGPYSVSTDGLSADGSCVAFETDERLAGTDTDSQTDLYKACGQTLTHESVGPEGGNAAEGVSPTDVSRDLRCVVFTTAERLTSDDTDSAVDAYKRCGSSLERVTRGPNGGNAQIDAEYERLSADGRCDTFSTVEHITADDTDAAKDTFKRCGSTTTRETQGPAGGNGNLESQVVGLSSDGARTLIQTNQRLTADDTDDSPDLYERSGGRTTRITPPDQSADHYGSNFSGMSEDGTRVVFSRYDSLAATDTDSSFDLYRVELPAAAPPTDPPANDGTGTTPPPDTGSVPADDRPADGPPVTPPAFAGVGIATRTAKVSNGTIAVKVSCPAAAQGACDGTLTLTARVGRKTLKLGARRFHIAAGAGKTLRVKLTRPAAKALARHGRLKATASATARDARGTSVTTPAAVTLKRSAKR